MKMNMLIYCNTALWVKWEGNEGTAPRKAHRQKVKQTGGKCED